MKSLAFATVAAVLTLVPAFADASVVQVGQNGFVIRDVTQVPASPEETWAVLVKPSVWWNSEHTWSGDAANLSLDVRAGGCFCEIMPGDGDVRGPARGSVEHMRVIFVDRARALRMTGALGPLQADALTGTLTVQLKGDDKGGTQVTLQYEIGGFSRTPFDKLAPAVDDMLGDQVKRLSAKLGGAFAAAFPAVDRELERLGTAPADEPQAPHLDVLPLPDTPAAADGPMVGR
ncbi:SRPBCC family protein [Novosphingobium gossypii]|uniref:SRPBCC family protein n=1 Tax=Novosphingobium gossypii TaxID=1604774 RepID=UPI003D19235E